MLIARGQRRSAALGSLSCLWAGGDHVAGPRLSAQPISACRKSHAGRIWSKRWLCPRMGPQASHVGMHAGVGTWSLTQAGTKAVHVGARPGRSQRRICGNVMQAAPRSTTPALLRKPVMDHGSQYLHWPGAITSSSKSSPPSDQLPVMHSCHPCLQGANFS